MLNTYIKNSGSNKTIIGNNCGKQFEELKWNAAYDGNKANILLKTNLNGKKKGYHYTLNNTDLADLFNMDTVNIPIHRRLKNDFRGSLFSNEPKIYKIELPETRTSSFNQTPYLEENPFSSSFDDSSSSLFTPSSNSSSSSRPSSSLMELLSSASPKSHFSSPSTNEEFIIPITLDESTSPYERYTFTPRRRNLTLKTHKTHRAFKRAKSSSRRSSSSRRRRSSKL